MSNKRPLTDAQARMLAYLASDGPRFTQRQLAAGAGFDHHQKAVAAVMGLMMKGYLVVDPTYLAELKENV
jgi:hypothetical protein